MGRQERFLYSAGPPDGMSPGTNPRTRARNILASTITRVPQTHKLEILFQPSSQAHSVIHTRHRRTVHLLVCADCEVSSLFATTAQTRQCVPAVLANTRCSVTVYISSFHVQIVRSVHFAASPTSDLMASGCRDKSVRVFSSSLQTMDPLVQFPALRDCVHSVKFFNEDKEILVAYSDAPGLSVLDVRTGAYSEHLISVGMCFACFAHLVGKRSVERQAPRTESETLSRGHGGDGGGNVASRGGDAGLRPL